MTSSVIHPKWLGEDVYIIGGGRSLYENKFNWSLLEDKNTIGCNTAFILGEKVCKICIFGDLIWFNAFGEQLEKYKGTVYTSCNEFRRNPVPWVIQLKRYENGLHLDGLGWNGNTGFNAINLALLLGAKRVLLLGFDMKLGKDGRANWHGKEIEKPTQSIYKKFLFFQSIIKKHLNEKFPEREIINITDDSDLTVFPKIGVQEYWKDKR
jgi:hypothetical protein